MHKKTVAVDLDGVLADYSRGWEGIECIGNPIPGAKQFLTQLAEIAKILIFTTRCCAEMNDRDGRTEYELQDVVRKWLDKHEMPYDDIYIGQGKPLFCCIVDDRAVSCQPQKFYHKDEYANALEEVRKFIDE